MSLRKLPELEARNLPEICAFLPDDEALKIHNLGLKAASDKDDASIGILDVIGADFWGDGVTAKRIAAALRSIGERDVVVNINSPGGDFFEGVAIYNLLRAHPAKVTVNVLGLAASAASVIAMAGDEIRIGNAGFIMIHNAWVVAIGDRHDLAEASATMEPFDDAMASVYADRSGADKDKVVAWMDEETWFNGEKAVSLGFADGLLPADMVKEDETQARAGREITALKRTDLAMAKAGMSRSERRALLGEVKGGTQGAAVTVTRDADEIAALCEGLFKI